MTFLAIAGIGIGLAFAVVAVGFIFNFWFELSDGEMWGLGACFASMAILAGVIAQAVVWVFP